MAKREEIEAAFNAAFEALAAIEHDRWSHWQRYMHAKGLRQPDGSLLLPSELVRQWDRQMNTPYSQLSEAEKNSDRAQVRRYRDVFV
jgi:hypothetical protein